MTLRPIITKDEARESAKRFKSALQATGIPFSRLYLFGSYAKGSPRRWSDIDIAVVSGDFGHDYSQESVLINRVADKIDPLIEAHPLSETELSDHWSTFAREVQTGEII